MIHRVVTTRSGISVWRGDDQHPAGLLGGADQHPAVTWRGADKHPAGARGVSAAPYDSFNLGDHVGDDPDAVRRNREQLAAEIALDPERVAWMNQTHSTHVRIVDEVPTTPFPDTDALVTSHTDVALAVLTADCVPVLAADPAAGVIAAAHAGRVGAAAGIVPRVIAAMTELGAAPERIEVLLGPAASGANYEVPPQMQAEVEATLPGSACTTERGTTGLDLRAGIAAQLRSLGVRVIAIDDRCTIADSALFSHRRGAPTGRLASVIWNSSRG